eukprot:1975173-Rhodomonas_salina.3
MPPVVPRSRVLRFLRPAHMFPTVGVPKTSTLTDADVSIMRSGARWRLSRYSACAPEQPRL